MSASGTSAARQTTPGVGVSRTTSTVQGEGVVARLKEPSWKYYTCLDTTKKNGLWCIFYHHLSNNGTTRIKLHLACIPLFDVNPCLKVPADVKEEILQYLTKKGNKKATKVMEQKRAICVVNLSHP